MRMERRDGGWAGEAEQREAEIDTLPLYETFNAWMDSLGLEING